ncbi:MAG: tRNA pseudouridine(55) synthase TruB [Myxococcota bacterium]
MNGLLIIDKPAGMTSHDVVYRVRKRVRVERVGHTGTLDPFATGVLPLCLGKATRLASLLTLEDKVYQATLTLGKTTDTLDRDGALLEERPVDPSLDEARVEAAMQPFRGEILQRPPMYSAVKVGGKRLYEYARAGEEVARAERPVTIYRLTLLSLSLPELRFEVHCSKGTYVRVLAAELGEALGCGGHLTELRRTQTGRFDLQHAVKLDELEGLVHEARLGEHIQPMTQLLPDVPSLSLTPAQAGRVRHGNPFTVRRSDRNANELPEEGLLQLLLDGELLALAELVSLDGQLQVRPKAVLTDG